MNQLRRPPRWIHVCLLGLIAVPIWAQGQSEVLAGSELVSQLRLGGYVIVMRHASSPRTPPDITQVNADNIDHERQLDLSGRLSATAMGASLRQMRIPIGSVMASPTYRALETVRLAQFGAANTYPQLGDLGQDMQTDSTGARAEWLRVQTGVRPAAGTNTLIVTHLPNISEAFPQFADQLADGESLIFRPDGHGAAAMVARVRVEQWSQLAALKLR
jgi:phosphohistidine phosphatase SixA